MKALLPLAAILFATAFCPAVEPITARGEHLISELSSMHVLEHWLAGGIVEWRTGDPTGAVVKDGGKHTHCSQFAAAACERLGIYILRPPEHGSVLLANAQYDWLPGSGGKKAGWSSVPNGVVAQDLANEGNVVVAVYKNGDPKKSGHIAIVRPGNRTKAEIAESGPHVIQAGGHNYESATLKEGFANHPGGFEHNEIRFYSHPPAKS